MPGWIWLLALVVGMTLLQLLIYRRLHEKSDGESPSGESPSSETPSGDSSDGPPFGGHLDFDPDRPGTLPGDDARHCPHCGAENDPDSVYTYCASCLRRLR